MNNRAFLIRSILICLAGAVCLFASGAGADFFNDSLLVNRAGESIRHRRILDDAYSERTGVPVSETVPRILPPKDYTRPQISYSDSIDSETMRVKQYRRIQGLRIDPYSIMTVDQYARRNLETSFYRQWTDPKKRLSMWKGAAGEKTGGGITDLDFVVPGSKALERFVGGQTRINIDGREKITFSGQSEWTEGQIETSVSKNSSFPSLTMKQEPSFRINGDVGRIHIDIKQDPQTGQLSNLEENINIKYQGEERDIIKFIEAGNTSLSLEGATFAGYRGTHKGLFGIRAEGQLGPMKFTTIASQEKSQANVKSFRGKAEESSNQVRDFEYKTSTYYFIDFKYRSQFANNRDAMDLIRYNPLDSLAVIEVYEDDSNIGNNLQQGTFAIRGIAYPMNMEENTQNPELGVDGYYHKLEPMKDYYVDRSLGYIRFMRRVPDQSTIGVYIRTKDGREYGTLDYNPNDSNSKIQLKLVKKKMQLPTDINTWDLEWKNVYDLGQTQIEPEGLELRIYREATDGVSKDTQDGIPLIHILGLDSMDEMGNNKPDNKIDLNRGFINFNTGELIFPDLQPFNPRGALPAVGKDLKDKVPRIYTTSNRQEMEEATRYYIEIKTSSRQSVIQIGSGFLGIMEGTEQVLLNGKALARGKDYRIDYQTGRVTLLSEEAQSPTADLQIRYEEPTAFQEMQKTLVGFRTEMDILSDSKIGAVTLFKNESTKDRRVKLGQEPSRMFLFDTDARFNFRSRTVTSLLDKLPGLVASEPSTFKIETEFARSMPTLNTRGMVYIDDFEGSQNIPIGVVRSKWTLASPPDPSTTNGRDMKRGRLQWYNPWNRIKSKDIWPDKETSAGENTVHVLNLAYGKPSGVPNDEAFAGVMTSFFGAGEDLSRARFIEIWARGAKGDLKLNIGSISEDFFPLEKPNGLLDTEDKPIPGQGHGDNVLTKEEDTGLDGMFDQEEKEYFLQLAEETDDPILKRHYQERALLPDPSGDNFYYKSGEKSNYTGINGTEGNAVDGDRMGFPDTEDINNNGILDIRNNYYEYTISFDNPLDKYLIPDSVAEGEPFGWRLFRIPLWNNPDAAVGGLAPPDSTLIEFARMWITNTDSTLIQIAEIQIVESTWLEQGVEGNPINDNVRVTNVNTHENSEYSPPPGVSAEIDRETKIRKKEQSLVVQVENLQPGNSAFIYRNFQKMNFTDYTSLKMYAHGPEDLPGEGALDSDVELVLRFGADRENYYEYRSDIFRGWDKRNFVDVDFALCTGLKMLEWRRDYLLPQDEVDSPSDPWYQAYLAYPDSVENTLGSWYEVYLEHAKFVRAPEDTISTKVYGIFGRPSLDNIKLISIGVKNDNENVPLTSDIWVNELRMDAERDMTGSAVRFDINTNLAGFINVVAGATRKEDDFHDMNSKIGTGSDATNWKANATMNLDRFAPNRWNLQIPISASTTQSSDLPRLKSGSDIILDQGQKKDLESTNADKKYRVSFSKGQDQSQEVMDILSWNDYKSLSFSKIKGTLIHWSFEKLNASYDFGAVESVSPFSGNALSENRQANVKYDVNPKEFEKKKKILSWLPILPFESYEKLADMEFTLTPSQLNYDYAYNDKSQYKTNTEAVSDTTLNRTADDRLVFGFDPIAPLKYTFTRETSKDLFLNQEVKFTEQNRISLTGPKMFYLQSNYSYSANYGETDNPRYSLQNKLGSKSIRLDKTFSITGALDIDKLFEDIAGMPKPPRQKFQRERKVKENWDAKEGAAADSSAAPGGTESKPAPPPPRPQKTERKTDPADTTADGQPKPKGPGIRMLLFSRVANALNPINLDYSVGNNMNYGGIKDRPDFSTRFGYGEVSEPDSITTISRQNSLAETKTYTAKSKVDLPLDIGVSVSGKYSENGTDSPSASSLTENTTPLDMSLTWMGLEKKIPYIEKYVTSLSLNSGYSMNNLKTFQNNELRSDKSESKFSPLFSINSQLFKKLNFTYSYSSSLNGTDDFSGGSISHSETSDINTSATLKYTISSASGLPIFKNIKLKSNIDLSMTYSTTANETLRGVDTEPMSLVASNDSWSWSPKAEYNFSTKFRGGMSMNFRNSTDMTKKVRKMREVTIWGEMMF